MTETAASPIVEPGPAVGAHIEGDRIVQEQSRPLGISVLAVLAAAGCGIGVFVLLTAATGSGEVRGGAWAWVVASALVLAAGATAYGLWNLRWWAWPLALLGWIGGGVEALVAAADGTFDTNLIIAPIAIVYLLSPETRRLFGSRVSAPNRSFSTRTVLLAVLLVALSIGGAAAAAWSPTVPAGAGTTLVAEVDLPPADVPGRGSEVALDDVELVASECLDRDRRPAGWLDLCWAVIRQPDGDPAGDYYRFEAWGTMGSDATDAGEAPGSGISWIVLRSDLLVPAVDGVFSAEPDGVREGCEASDLDPFATLGAGLPELPCDGRTTGVADLRTHTVTWTCVGCPLGADRLNRAIGMSEDVKVGEGVVPSWALYADFGD